MQRCEITIEAPQFLERTGFAHAPILDQEDPVGVLNSRHSVRDNNHGDPAV
jgi:hypothetical protein